MLLFLVAVFEVFLPNHRTRDENSSQQNMSAKIRILTVNTPDEVDLYCDHLQKEGAVEVCEFMSVKAAIEELERSSFDLVVTFLVDESALLDAAVKANAKVRTIGVSSVPDDRVELKECGYTCAVHPSDAARAIDDQLRVLRHRQS